MWALVQALCLGAHAAGHGTAGPQDAEPSSFVAARPRRKPSAAAADTTIYSTTSSISRPFTTSSSSNAPALDFDVAADDDGGAATAGTDDGAEDDDAIAGDDDPADPGKGFAFLASYNDFVDGSTSSSTAAPPEMDVELVRIECENMGAQRAFHKKSPAALTVRDLACCWVQLCRAARSLHNRFFAHMPGTIDKITCT